MEENHVAAAVRAWPRLADLGEETIKRLVFVRLMRVAGKSYREFPKTLGTPFGDEERGDYEKPWPPATPTIEHA